jgi:amidase
LTRTVRDSAAVLDLTAGPMPGDPYAAPPGGEYLPEVGAPPGRLRIGFTAQAPTGVSVSPEAVDGVTATAALCASLGHHVEEATLRFDARAFEDAFFVLYAAGAAWRLDAWERVLGRCPLAGELEPFTVALVDLGRRYTAVEYLLAVEELQIGARRIARFHAEYDLFLTPTLASVAVPLGYFDPPADDPIQVLYTDAAFSPFTWIANATGQPAMSVPLHWTAAGLPIGSHFTAASGREDVLFRLAAQLEQAQPWAHRRPG